MSDEPLDISGPGTAVVRTEAPIGPLVGVMPWIYPYYQVARFAAPNIALGNTIILKHARNCPQSALAVERVLLEASLPEGVYLNAFISTAQVAAAIADPRVQGVSVTGSEKAGSAVGEVAGRHMKKVVLELSVARIRSWCSTTPMSTLPRRPQLSDGSPTAARPARRRSGSSWMTAYTTSSSRNSSTGWPAGSPPTRPAGHEARPSGVEFRGRGTGSACPGSGFAGRRGCDGR